MHIHIQITTSKYTESLIVKMPLLFAIFEILDAGSTPTVFKLFFLNAESNTPVLLPISTARSFFPSL